MTRNSLLIAFFFSLLLAYASGGCQPKSDAGPTDEPANASGKALTVATTPAAPDTLVTHCYAHAGLYFDYVRVTEPDGSLLISCSVSAGSFTEVSAFAAYSPTLAPSSQGHCVINSPDVWTFTYDPVASAVSVSVLFTGNPIPVPYGPYACVSQ